MTAVSAVALAVAVFATAADQISRRRSRPAVGLRLLLDKGSSMSSTLLSGSHVLASVSAVDAAGNATALPDGVTLTGSDSTELVITTNPDGTWSVAGGKAGSAVLIASAPGVTSATVPIVVQPGPAAALAVTLAAPPNP